MTGRHTGALALDGCRNRTPRGFSCGHNAAAHDLPDGGCSVCPDPTCPRYRSNLLPPVLVLGALVLLIGAVLIVSGVLT